MFKVFPEHPMCPEGVRRKSKGWAPRWEVAGISARACSLSRGGRAIREGIATGVKREELTTLLKHQGSLQPALSALTARHRGCQQVLVEWRNGKKDGNMRENPRISNLISRWMALLQIETVQVRMGRQSESDDKFSFRRVGSYVTQAFRGLPRRVKVKVRNREVGIMITENECMTGGWTYQVNESKTQRTPCPVWVSG